MFEFKPEKLFVDFKKGVTEKSPVIPRTYTMTHSDETADLFVTVGEVYDYSKITSFRDEVLAEWVNEDDIYKLKVYVQVDGDEGIEATARRDEIFRRELGLALTAIRYGDDRFFCENNDLDNAPIIVYFNSRLDNYNKKEEWGTFKDYKYNDEKDMENYLISKEDEVLKHGVRSIDRVASEKCEVEKGLILNLLNPYIQNQIWITYGRIEYFCLSEVDILSITPIRVQHPCRRKFEIAVGIKVGKNPPPYNNLIIEFLVASNGVTTKSVKNPR